MQVTSTSVLSSADPLGSLPTRVGKEEGDRFLRHQGATGARSAPARHPAQALLLADGLLVEHVL